MLMGVVKEITLSMRPDFISRLTLDFRVFFLVLTQASISEFLNRHVLQSLLAGIEPACTYLHRVRSLSWRYAATSLSIMNTLVFIGAEGR